MSGMIEASTTRRLRTPWTNKSGPTTPPSSRGIIAAVPIGWNVEAIIVFRIYSPISWSLVILEPGVSSTGASGANVFAALYTLENLINAILVSRSSGFERVRKSTMGSPLGSDMLMFIEPRLKGFRLAIPLEHEPPWEVWKEGILSDA